MEATRRPRASCTWTTSEPNDTPARGNPVPNDTPGTGLPPPPESPPPEITLPCAHRAECPTPPPTKSGGLRLPARACRASARGRHLPSVISPRSALRSRQTAEHQHTAVPRSAKLGSAAAHPAHEGPGLSGASVSGVRVSYRLVLPERGQPDAYHRVLHRTRLPVSLWLIARHGQG